MKNEELTLLKDNLKVIRENIAHLELSINILTKQDFEKRLKSLRIAVESAQEIVGK